MVKKVGMSPIPAFFLPNDNAKLKYTTPTFEHRFLEKKEIILYKYGIFFRLCIVRDFYVTLQKFMSWAFFHFFPKKRKRN